MSANEDDARRRLTDRYNREATDYRNLWAPTLRIAGRRLLGELAHRPARRILDVATGVGSLLPDLRATFPAAQIVGVDRSRGMLAHAPAGYPTAVMDATQLGVASESVDLLLLVFVLFHLPEPAQGVREAHRVLRAGGTIGCITWAGDFESTASRIWDDCLDSHGAPTSEPAIVARHDAVDTPDKLDALLRGAGFTAVRCWEEDLVDRFDVDRLLRLRTSLGSSKPRFDGLEPAAREACILSARSQMERLAPDDFITRGGLVYSIADR